MQGFLRQSTASQTRVVGPFLDDTDFKTPETALTIANTDVKLKKNGTAANKNSGGGTHTNSGDYSLTFDATDTATVGELKGTVVVAGALPVFFCFLVLEEAVYDALFAASAAGYQVPIWSAVGATVNLSGTTIKDVTDVNEIVGDAYSGNREIRQTLDYGVPVNIVNDKGGYTLSAAGNGSVAGAVWDALTSGIVAVGSIGVWIKTKLDAVVSTIKTKTDNLPADPADASDIASSVGALSTLVGQVKLKTDKLEFDVENYLKANAGKVGGVPLTGDGKTIPVKAA